MEISDGEREIYQEDEPHFAFTILGKKVNLADAFSPDVQKRRETNTFPAVLKEQETPEDKAAARLLWALESSGVTFDEYRRAMPRLFEYAQNKERKFDVARIGVIFNQLDRTAEEMQVGRSAKVVSHGVDAQGHQIVRAGWRGQLHETDRGIFFARSFGFVEAVNKAILNFNDPGLAAQKKRILDYGLTSPWLRDIRSSTPTPSQS